MVVGVFDGKITVLIHSIHNIPAAVDCIGVTDTICHNVIERSTNKPTNCTGKPDIRRDWSIGEKSGCTTLVGYGNNVRAQDGGNTHESSKCHSICSPEVDFTNFVVDIPAN
jgi:hypothetical protein